MFYLKTYSLKLWRKKYKSLDLIICYYRLGIIYDLPI